MKYGVGGFVAFFPCSELKGVPCGTANYYIACGFVHCSLHDVHCRKLFMNNKHVKNHLVNLGLVSWTEEGSKVVGKVLMCEYVH